MSADKAVSRIHRRIIVLLLASLASLATVPGGWAQSPSAPSHAPNAAKAKKAAPAKKAATPAKQTSATPPPAKPMQASPLVVLDRDIFRLSEIAGSLALLRSLCETPDADAWPKTMQALLAAEGTSPDRRARLAGAYNRGYRNYALTYRTCTASAEEAATRYMRESDKLSRSILNRYGN